MADREKVIKGLERCRLYNKVNCDKCPYDYNGRGNGKSECTAELASDALALLKGQEAHKFFVDESGKITPLPVVVRCKDCKYHGNINEDYCQCLEQETNNEFFCWYGERKEGR